MKEIEELFKDLPEDLRKTSVKIALITAYYRGADAYRRDPDTFGLNTSKDFVDLAKLLAKQEHK